MFALKPLNILKPLHLFMFKIKFLTLQLISVFVLFSLVVEAQNPPVIVTTPTTTAPENIPYSYGLRAEDVNNDVLTFSAPTLPSWLTFSATGQATPVQFGTNMTSPGGVAGDANGNIYVAELSGTNIFKIKPDGTTTVFAQKSTGIGSTYSMLVVGDYLYLSFYRTTTGYIKRISLSNPGAGEEEVFNSVGSSYEGQGGVLSMTEKDGFLYACLYPAGKIMKLNLTDFTTSDYVTGIGANEPFGLGFDASGNLYITRYQAKEVLKWDGTTFTTVLSSLPAFVTDIKIDKLGYKYISFNSGKIRKYSSDFSTYTEIGTSILSWGMTLTPNGSLVYGDNNNNRINRLQTGASLTGTPTSNDVGVHPVVLQVSDGTNVVNQSFNITVTDPNPPTVSTYSPVLESSTSESNTNISLTFNENIKKGTGFITIRKMSDKSLYEQIDVTSDRVSISGKTITINPNLDFIPNQDFYVLVDATAILDLNNNAYSGINSHCTWYFNTVKGNQTLTFASTSSVNYGVADFSPNATSNNSSITINYTSSDLSVATIVNNKIHVLKPGTTIITATQAGNDFFNAATNKTQTLTINPKPVNVSFNNTLISKEYDGNANVVISNSNFNLDEFVANDQISIKGDFAFINKEAGIAKAITGNNLSLDGVDKDKYVLQTTGLTTTGNITSKPLTVALKENIQLSKTYNGNTSIVLPDDYYSITGNLIGDDVKVQVGGNFTSKEVGEAKAIALNSFVIEGAQKSNYSVSTSVINTTGNITAKPLTVSLKSTPEISKTYDGNANVVLPANQYTLTGVENGDEVVVSGTAVYNSKEAGDDKIITVNNFTLSGAQKNNYVLNTLSATVGGKILKKELTVTASDKSRFQGLENPVLTYTISGFINGESESQISTKPVISTSATATSEMGVYAINLSGGIANNYSFKYVPGKLTVIAGAPSAINLAEKVIFENQPAGTVAGILSSESQDQNATYTYSLVIGAGGEDNNLFSILNNELRTNSPLDFESKSAYKVLVRSKNQYNLFTDKSFVINIKDVNESPTMSAISNQVICYTEAPQTIELKGVSAGPETAQQTKLSVSVSNSNLFDKISVNGNVLNYTVKAGQSGISIVTVTVKDNGGVENGGVDTYSRAFSIQVNAMPNTEITSSKGVFELSKGDAIQLIASGGDIYEWDNAPGIVSGKNTSVLTIRPEQTTTYKVTVKSTSGCTSYKEITVRVNDDFLMVKRANILTPNGDGINDYFVIENIDMYPKNELVVFDNNGRVIYRKENYKNEWDGTFKGIGLAKGTYYYILDFGDAKPKLKGFISVLGN